MSEDHPTDPSELSPGADHEAYAMRLDNRLAKIEDNLAGIVDKALQRNNKFVQGLFDSINGQLHSMSSRLDSVEQRRNGAPWVVAGSVAALLIAVLALGVAAANRVTLEVRQSPPACVR